MNLEDITVVVPTRNERDNVGIFLGSLPERVSLVVVDASDDGTPEIIRGMRTRRTLVISHPGSISQARQIGAEHAGTPWLVFADADVAFAPDYFERLCRRTGWDAVYGPKHSRDQFCRYYRWFARGQRLLHGLGAPSASGSNLAMRKDALNAVGGFDARLVCNEDSELVWRVKRAGFRVEFDAGLIVYAYDHRRLHRGLWRKSVHSLARCALLYFNAMPSRWRSHDWGYWAPPRKRATSARD